MAEQDQKNIAGGALSQAEIQPHTAYLTGYKSQSVPAP